MGRPETDDIENYDDNEADLIPGDNSTQSPTAQPGLPDSPDNLVKIPDSALPTSKDLGGSPT
jgi:hypothetical protein